MPEETPVDERIENAVELANETGTFSEEQVRQAGSLLTQDQPALTSNDLNDVQDFQFVQPETPTADSSLSGQLEASLRQNQAERQSRAEEARTQQDDSLAELTSFLESSDTESELRDRFARETGVDEAQRELDEYDSQLEQEQLALRRASERIQTESGLTRAQANARIAEISRKSLSKQADIAVLRNASQRKFDSAKAILDRKVDIELERDEKKLQALTLTYQANKELFTREEQRAFEAGQLRLQNEIDDKRSTLNTINQYALTFAQNGAPDDVVQSALNAKSVSELLSIPGISGYLKSKEQKLQEQLLGIKVQSEIDASLAAKDARENGLLTDSQYELADNLRKEYNSLQEVKDSKDLEANTSSLLIALAQEDGVSDISAINTFQRLVVDPGVAVREGDVSLLQSAQSFTDKATLRARGLMVGDKLTANAREQMKQLALDVYDARKAIVESQTAPIRNRADEGGIDFGRYIGNHLSSAESIRSRVQSLDPAQSILDSYDDDVVSPETTNDIFIPWLLNQNF